MTSTRYRMSSALAGCAMTLALGACIVTPAPRPYYEEPVVAVAPPPPQVEVVGVAPVTGYVWIGGYWGWAGGRHVWVPGHWDAPRAGYFWVPHRWVAVGPRWRLAPGHWERR